MNKCHENSSLVGLQPPFKCLCVNNELEKKHSLVIALKVDVEQLISSYLLFKCLYRQLFIEC